MASSCSEEFHAIQDYPGQAHIVTSLTGCVTQDSTGAPDKHGPPQGPFKGLDFFQQSRVLQIYLVLLEGQPCQGKADGTTPDTPESTAGGSAFEGGAS